MNASMWLMVAGLVFAQEGLQAQTTASTSAAPGQAAAGQSSESVLPPKSQAQSAEDYELHPERPGAYGPGRLETNGINPGRSRWFSNQKGIAGIQTNLSTSDPGRSNRLYPFAADTNLYQTNGTLRADLTNHLALTNQFAITSGDHAVTVVDQRILVDLHERVWPLLGGRERRSAVQFLCDHGHVKVLGPVPTAEAGAQIVAAVQGTPGVVAVENGLVVGNAPATPDTAAQQVGAGEANLGGTVVGGDASPISPLPAPVVLEDKAFKAADQELLDRLRQAVLPVFHGAAASMPVHFICEEGKVTVTGYAISPVQKEAVLSAVRRTRGVANVLDELRVSSESPPAATAPGVTPGVGGS